MKIRKATIEKVRSYLRDLKEGCESSDITNLRRNAEFYNLCGGAYSPVMRAMGVVKKEGRTYVWKGGKITRELAEEIVKYVNLYVHAK